MSLELMATKQMTSKKTGRPPKEHKYVSVKLREDLADAARVVCAARKISIGEYLSELTSSAILRDQASAAKRLLDQPKR